MTQFFFGFPSGPSELVHGIEAGIEAFRSWQTPTKLVPWTDLQGPTVPIVPEITKTILSSSGAFFDVSAFNENVFYEIGYTIGADKIIHILVNRSIGNALSEHRGLGIFDTQRLKLWSNGGDLAQLLRSAEKPYRAPRRSHSLDQKHPLFFQNHLEKIEFATKYFSEVKAQHMSFRQHDPEEDQRLPLDRAYDQIASSAGVFLSILPGNIKGSAQHNLRCYLLAGIADGAGVPRIILKYGDFSAPFDLRDGVVEIKHPDDISDHVHSLIPRVHKRQQEMDLPAPPTSKSTLVALQLGASAAENEVRTLDSYFVDTREFRRTQRGEARLVVGRKGAGKTAIFWQVRNRSRANKKNVVLDLRPEGFQLIKLNELIHQYFSKGTQQHTLTHFWEYVLYLELAHKLLSDDERLYGRDPTVTQVYEELQEEYENVTDLRTGDFPERLLRLIQRLRQDIASEFKEDDGRILSAPEITNLIYRTDFPNLKSKVIKYLQIKNSCLILVDNLDRGWTAAGVSPTDVANIQCLLDAGRRIEREASKSDVIVKIILFLRDDVYDWLVKAASDRGKDTIVRIHWEHEEQLLELIERRLTHSSKENNIQPALKWTDISEDLEGNRSLFTFLVNNCFRRPRALIDLIELSLSNAVIAGRDKITKTDCERAVSSYSADILTSLNFEICDIFPEGNKIIYEFAKENIRLDKANVERIAKAKLKESVLAERFVRIMLWFGFFGILGEQRQEVYIFDHGGNIDLLLAHSSRSENPILCIHPLFRKALSLREDTLL